jgi:ubiquinone/menaquinone biosynthesis C-methylase UbiE
MKAENKSEALQVLPVPRTKEEAKRFYDRISRAYDYFTGAFERKHAERALECLSINEGEAVLEIGFGSGSGARNWFWLRTLSQADSAIRGRDG